MPHPVANHSGQKDKGETWQPDPDEFTLHHRPPSGAEERLDPHRRNLDGCPGQEIPICGKGREEGDPAPAVCQGIEETVACPDEKEEEKIAKPASRKECLAPEEKKHQQKAND